MADRDVESSATSNWGNCQRCKWWQIEPQDAASASTHGVCTEKSLRPYLLRVSGSSGCGLFVGRSEEAARASGSAAVPPDSRSIPGTGISAGGEP